MSEQEDDMLSEHDDQITIDSNNVHNGDDPYCYFEHIYNGIIFTNGTFYPMIEFKIVNKDKNAEEKSTLFVDVHFKCGWFIIDPAFKKLAGPIKINTIKIIDNIREISDYRYPEINSKIIDSVSNEDESLISKDDIPSWMYISLISNIIKHLR